MKKEITFDDYSKIQILIGTVLKVSKNRYIEQTTQWKKLFTKTELINFFIREFKN